MPIGLSVGRLATSPSSDGLLLAHEFAGQTANRHDEYRNVDRLRQVLVETGGRCATPIVLLACAVSEIAGRNHPHWRDSADAPDRRIARPPAACRCTRSSGTCGASSSAPHLSGSRQYRGPVRPSGYGQRAVLLDLLPGPCPIERRHRRRQSANSQAGRLLTLMAVQCETGVDLDRRARSNRGARDGEFAALPRSTALSARARTRTSIRSGRSTNPEALAQPSISDAAPSPTAGDSDAA